MSPQIDPFTIHATDAQLEDLGERLRRTRWPEPEPVEDDSQGLPLTALQAICAHWAERYDWREREERLNRWPQYRTEIDGVDVHFMHVPSPEPDAMPLLLTHGWPGSVVEFAKVLGPLTDPARHGGEPGDAFEVVCPSLPGFGFSSKPGQTGWGVQRIARAWAQLMSRLGLTRYVAQGGDWGAMITTALADVDPDHCAGIHLNMAMAFPTEEDLADLTEAEQAVLADLDHYQRWGSGYSKQQSTRPQTLGYGLVDSPAGQAAWILEKFWAWTDHDGDLEGVIARDELLDNVMLYWLPATGASSGRLYWESFHDVSLDPVEAPTGISVFPKEIFRTSRRWAERRYRDLRHFGTPERGGHFAAFEQPELFVEEVRAAFRTMR
jgi:epoxide hydrolase